jgi:hypothetical protein
LRPLSPPLPDHAKFARFLELSNRLAGRAATALAARTATANIGFVKFDMAAQKREVSVA